VVQGAHKSLSRREKLGSLRDRVNNTAALSSSGVHGTRYQHPGWSTHPQQVRETFSRLSFHKAPRYLMSGRQVQRSWFASQPEKVGGVGGSVRLPSVEPSQGKGVGTQVPEDTGIA